MKNIKIERLCIVLSIAIVLFGAGAHLYRWWRVSSLEAQARAEEEKAAELERQAKEAEAKKEAEEKAAEEKAKKEAEEKAKTAEEVDKALDIGLTEEIDAALPEEIKQANEEFLKEARAITEVLIKLNKAQNNADYRTITGREGEEYMTEEYRKRNAEEAEETVNYFKENQIVCSYKGLRILEMTIGSTNAEVTYEGTAEINSTKGTELSIIRWKAILEKENNTWYVDNEEALGRVIDDEN